MNYELRDRPKKNEIGDMFNILSHGFPYDKILIKYGFDPNSSVPRSIFITE